MRISYKRVIWNKSSLIFTIFSAFLDHPGAQNALQTFSSLTDQLKISYLQHWVYLNTIFFRYYSTVIILRGKVIARWVIMSNIYRKITFLLRFITCCMYWYFLMGNAFILYIFIVVNNFVFNSWWHYSRTLLFLFYWCFFL